MTYHLTSMMIQPNKNNVLILIASYETPVEIALILSVALYFQQTTILAGTPALP